MKKKQHRSKLALAVFDGASRPRRKKSIRQRPQRSRCIFRAAADDAVLIGQEMEDLAFIRVSIFGSRRRRRRRRRWRRPECHLADVPPLPRHPPHQSAANTKVKLTSTPVS